MEKEAAHPVNTPLEESQGEPSGPMCGNSMGRLALRLGARGNLTEAPPYCWVTLVRPDDRWMGDIRLWVPGPGRQDPPLALHGT